MATVFNAYVISPDVSDIQKIKGVFRGNVGVVGHCYTSCAVELLRISSEANQKIPNSHSSFDATLVLVVVPGREFVGLKSMNDMLGFAQMHFGLPPARPEDMILLRNIKHSDLRANRLLLAHVPIEIKPPADSVSYRNLFLFRDQSNVVGQVRAIPITQLLRSPEKFSLVFRARP